MYLKSLFITVVVCSATMANAQTCDITEEGDLIQIYFTRF